MGDREPTRYGAAEIGLVLVVLCIGLAGGSMLATGPSPARPLTPAVAQPETGRAAAPAAEAVEQPLGAGSHEPVGDDSIPAGSPYVPVSGSLAFRESVAAETPQPSIADAPPEAALPTPAREEPSGSGLATDSVQSSPAPARTSTREDDDVASLGPGRASGAVLFAVSSGDQTVLFDVGVAGAGVLPPSIRGRWAWVGTCSHLRVDISQLPGAPPGNVRGVGTGAREDRYGWVVPRTGCPSASRRILPPGTIAGRPDGAAPGEVRELRSLGELPCEGGRSCRWFAGLDGRGRPVALLVSGGGERWIRLGPGS